MKKWIVAFIALLFALPALGAPVVSGNTGAASTSPGYEVSIGFSQSDTSDSEAIYVRGTCAIRATVAGSDVLQVWQVTLPTTAASSGTQLGSDITLSTSAPISWNPGTYFVKVKSSTATTGGSSMKITCSNAQVTAVPMVSGPTVASGGPFERLGGTFGSMQLPAVSTFGHVVAMEGTPTFSAAKYPGGTAGQGSEPNNQMGWIYNKFGIIPTGVSAIINLFETSWDFSWELSYRKSDPGGTTDETWTELNWDVAAPDFTTTTTGGAAGTFVAGDRVSCSGGGSVYVVAYPSANNLTFRQDYGRCLAGEVLTNQTGVRTGNTATLGTLTATPNYSRPLFMAYKHLSQNAVFEFTTTPSETNNAALSVSAGFLRTHNRIVPGTVAAGTVNLPASTAIASGACNTSATGVTATGATVATDVIRWTPQIDISGVTGYGPTGGGLVIYPYVTANAVNFKICNPTAGSITTGATTITINWLVDRWL